MLAQITQRFTEPLHKFEDKIVQRGGAALSRGAFDEMVERGNRDASRDAVIFIQPERFMVGFPGLGEEIKNRKQKNRRPKSEQYPPASVDFLVRTIGNHKGGGQCLMM